MFAAALLLSLIPCQDSPRTSDSLGTHGPPGSHGVRFRRSLDQFGIGWVFEEGHLAGRFANGDWWVVGPVRVVRIFPRSHGVNGRIANGSMVNPSPTLGRTQGYDEAMYGPYADATSYDPSLNVARGVSPAHPLVLAPGSSLVSTRSVATPGARPQIETAAILTVLERVPPADAFRPPYCGGRKTILFRRADLDRSVLLRLARPASTPPIAQLERDFERPWLDHVPGWISRYTHPSENMPDYGRDMADRIGNASLILNLDFTVAEKETLLVRLVQLGIDLFGVLSDGGAQNWQAGGGHHSGRKWPILFAGIVLRDPAMSSIGLDPSLLFMGEDGQTFYVRETSPGVYNRGYGGYGPQQVGMPEWGQKHALDPSLDDADWFADPYRTCCTANAWTGIVLAARMLGARPLWNHDALFDYQDRYVSRQKALGGSVATSRFALDMWNAYRGDF